MQLDSLAGPVAAPPRAYLEDRASPGLQYGEKERGWDRAGRVFVTGGGDGTSVSVLDARTGRLVHTVPTGTYPGIVAVDKGHGHAFVAIGDTTGNRVLVLDARTGTVRRTIPIRREIVKAMVVDERTGRAFVVSASPTGDGWLSTLGAAP